MQNQRTQPQQGNRVYSVSLHDGRSRFAQDGETHIALRWSAGLGCIGFYKHTAPLERKTEQINDNAQSMDCQPLATKVIYEHPSINHPISATLHYVIVKMEGKL